MDDLYKEIILDHYHHPRNVGKLEGGHIVHVHLANAGCGDVFDVTYQVENGKIANIAWQGEGCAISTASMSLVSEWLKGKTLEEANGLDQKTILSLLGLDEIAPVREKCAFLPLQLW
ncbi:Fe-S cluster protein [Candidatus Cerribacteria bacterium 'Amazon FNV 2010 28 9']|uniref:Fe-S cluster protein n=1 Tax=Candidatus Cerribacteria bacterium 'Amazon FNV 2010 28 9' TaxID=2081795 RepID=A0A317JRL0_9BACT|nr:MAG: Fe-S cluster protein [Candidatus Cerribacteria bacterium 'Amazon FNV 2010 28 9']